MSEDIKDVIVAKIKLYLELIEITKGSENKLPILTHMLDYFHTIPNFLCSYPKFRVAVVKKLEELKLDNVQSYYNDTYDIKLDSLKTFIDSLKFNPNYKPYNEIVITI